MNLRFRGRQAAAEWVKSSRVLAAESPNRSRFLQSGLSLAAEWSQSGAAAGPHRPRSIPPSTIHQSSHPHSDAPWFHRLF